MSKQRHIIKRQLLEVTVAEEKEGAVVQRTLQNLQRDQLVKIIDKICSRLSAPELIHRIDKLELDLGNISIDNFEKEFVAQFEKSFEAALKVHTRPFSTKALQEIRESSHAEIVELFLETGTLPWWVEASHGTAFSESFSYLIQTNPDRIAAWVTPQLDLLSVLERLVYHLNDPLLYELGELIKRGFKLQWPTLDKELTRLMASFPRSTAFSQKDLRLKRWKALFFSLKTQPPFDELFRQVLLQIAADMGVPPSQLSDYLKNYQIENRNVNIKEILRPLISPNVASVDESRRLFEDIPLSSQLIQAIRRFLERWEKGLKEIEFKREISVLERALSQEIQSNTEIESQHLRELQQLLRMEQEGDILFNSLLEWMRAFSKKPSIQGVVKGKKENGNSIPDSSSRFSQADELYLTNAGLVLLWPFLNQLFEIAEWVEKGKFLSEELAHKGMSLLQILVDPDAEINEYVLPLNKILCGLGLETVAQLTFDFSEEEKKACEAFLESVIKQAPILNEMSVDGFRQAFLRRKGILSVRDGGWLLRVERETHDVVLDKFPWSFQFVRLPWMEAPLFIEW